MLVWLLESLQSELDWIPSSLDKVTLRTAMAAMASFALALLLGPRLIVWLKDRFREPNTSPSPRVRELHRNKRRTPTMGGLFIVLGIVVSTLIFGDLSSPYLLVALLLVASLAVLGAVDDLAKLSNSKRGLSARTKLAGQAIVATVVAVLVYHLHSEVPGGLDLTIPVAGVRWSLGWWFVPLSVLVLVGSSNAVNLTDGLDGLAGGCLVFAVCGMAVICYASSHAVLAEYLGMAHIPGSGEMVVLAGGIIGGLLGFVWFNCHPAQVFMGDTGSLPLGGLLGLMAVVARGELLLLVVGGVFVVEAASVIIQVVSFKWHRRRVFLCAPLHHHFQFRGWPENQIVVRFWIASALCAILGVAGMKLQVREPTAPAGSPQAQSKLDFQAIGPLTHWLD